MKYIIRTICSIIIMMTILIAIGRITNLAIVANGVGRSMDGPDGKSRVDYAIMISPKIYQDEIQRFDIVSFREKEEPKTAVMKRIIGLPGETIEAIGEVIYINGEILDDIYGSYHSCLAPGAIKGFKVELQDDEYLVLGDNRCISHDSRYYGPIKKEDIEYIGIWHIGEK